MSDLRTALAPYTLTQVRLVGTHNSATYAISSSSPFGKDAVGCTTEGCVPFSTVVGAVTRRVTPPWARCQGVAVTEQLRRGVRYLDLRVTSVNSGSCNGLYITHSQVSISVEKVVEEVVAFLSDPDCADEFVVLDFQHFYGMDEDSHVEAFFSCLSPLFERCVPASSALSSTLSALWEASPRGRVLLIVGLPFDEDEYPFVLPRSDAVTSDWKDRVDASELLHTFTEDIRYASSTESGHSPDAEPPSSLFVTQAILSPVTSTIVKGLLLPCGSVTSVEDLSHRVNSHALKWFWDWNAINKVDGTTLTPCRNVHRNVLLLDFVEFGEATILEGDRARTMNAAALCVFLNLIASAQTPQERSQSSLESSSHSPRSFVLPDTQDGVDVVELTEEL